MATMSETVNFPRLLDRLVVRAIAIYSVAGGTYLVTVPLDLNLDHGSSILKALGDAHAVFIIGIISLLSGLYLGWSVRREHTTVKHLSRALFINFCLRLFVLGGTFLVSPLLPPTYLPSVVVTFIVGVYFIAVKLNAYHR